ncbi:PREDICTED: SLIT-ROBO Rho GTPase-activating protein 1-like [Priapulus caudatus]|uniref:SLIT-ROBO Rho GTPase-activating protein 1-like n=1 Tax=Priapulus caudatus TaxID=37621 RepID=A0ABM1EA28_PRICU|nr:PREDICTED: SLIT-ROBO Rho GTPase-activating protein 1-like [Priapulus caudatus]
MRVLNELHTTLKTYHLYQTECRQSEVKLRNVENQRGKLDQSLSKEKLAGSRKARMLDKEICKRAFKHSENEMKAIKARNEYLLCLESANAAIHKYYVEDVSDLIDCVDFGFHNSVARAFMMHISCEEACKQTLQSGITAMDECIRNLDARKDKQSFLEAYSSSFVMPSKFLFKAHKDDKVNKFLLNKGIQEEVVQRYQQLCTRLTDLRTEGEEVWKTLESNPSVTGNDIPRIVQSCIRTINLYGLHHQGLFRVSGSQLEITELKNQFEKGDDPLLHGTECCHDINSVAGLLKLYLRELRQPLFPVYMFDQFVNCAYADRCGAVAQYDYDGRSERELTFRKGASITLHSQVSVDWWQGSIEGKEGLVPDKYIAVAKSRDTMLSDASSKRPSSCFESPMATSVGSQGPYAVVQIVKDAGGAPVATLLSSDAEKSEMYTTPPKKLAAGWKAEEARRMTEGGSSGRRPSGDATGSESRTATLKAEKPGGDTVGERKSPTTRAVVVREAEDRSPRKDVGLPPKMTIVKRCDAAVVHVAKRQDYSKSKTSKSCPALTLSTPPTSGDNIGEASADATADATADVSDRYMYIQVRVDDGLTHRLMPYVYLTYRCVVVVLYRYMGAVNIDVPLPNIDVNQCPGNVSTNLFAGTDKCKPTTQVTYFIDCDNDQHRYGD